MRVLLVDDEKELVSAMAERLAFRGIEADWVTDGRQALEKARQTRYDVFVLDVKMPGASGHKVMEDIKKILPHAGFVFLTGHSSEEDKARGEAAGASFYLMKPLKIDILVEKLKQAAAAAGEQPHGSQ